MTIREALKAAQTRLEKAGVPNADFDAREMLAHVLGENALMMRMQAGRDLPQDQLAV